MDIYPAAGQQSQTTNPPVGSNPPQNPLQREGAKVTGDGGAGMGVGLGGWRGGTLCCSKHACYRVSPRMCCALRSVHTSLTLVVVVAVVVVVVDRFYIALFSTLEQTHCARMLFYTSDIL